MISGHVIVKGTEENIPYATILIKESGQGTVSNEEGQFEFRKLPVGKYTLRVSAVGYKTQEKEVTVSKDFTAVIHFQMQEESFMTDEVVVSANRNEVSRKDAPVVVNVMSAKLFEMVNSTDLAKTLNYQSGLRVENDCQNCGFPQVRINGLEGPYSQILIVPPTAFAPNRAEPPPRTTSTRSIIFTGICSSPYTPLRALMIGRLFINI